MSLKYLHDEAVHNLKTPELIAPLIIKAINPRSVLDVGCGLGTWLKAFEQLGVNDIVGVEGEWVKKELMKISPDQLHIHDLSSPLNLSRKFDLVISLEVVEHLEPSFSKQFIQSLVDHGDVILFSAAIPGQGGQNHLNERWLSAWVEEFGVHRYRLVDLVRPWVWSNPTVEIWYKQNMVLFIKEDNSLLQKLSETKGAYVDIVHPDLFSFYRNQAQRGYQLESGELGIKLSLRSLIMALRNKLS